MKRGAIVLCWVALSSLSLAAGDAPSSGEAGQPLALVGGTLLDLSSFGRSTADVKDAVVLIRGDRIVAAGPRRSIPIPSGARVVDVSGGYLVPGLFDMFATQNNQAQANAHLYMGVTSIVGLQDLRRGPLFLEANPSPRVHRLAGVTGLDISGLDPPPRTIDDARKRGRRLRTEELEAQVDSMAKEGVKVLLLYYSLPPDQVRVVVRRARERGLAVIGELGDTTYAQGVELGIPAFVHTSRYSLDLAPQDLRAEVAALPFGPARLRYYEMLAGLDPQSPSFARHATVLSSPNVALIPTLALISLELPDHDNPWAEPAAAILDPKDIHLPADPKTGRREASPGTPSDAFPPGVAEASLRIEEGYRRAGARYLAGSGTDAFGTLPGISLHTELKLLARIGLSPREALAAATSNVGAVFGWDDVGQIKAGCRADVLVLEGDPTKDLANLKRIRHLILKGERVDREALLKR